MGRMEGLCKADMNETTHLEWVSNDSSGPLLHSSCSPPSRQSVLEDMGEANGCAAPRDLVLCRGLN